MRWPAIALAAALAAGLTACDKIPDVKSKLSGLPVVGKYFEAEATDTAATDTTAVADTAAAGDTGQRTVARQQPQRAQPARQPPRTGGVQPAAQPPTRREPRPVPRQLVDQPWFPVDTGTVRPGMTRDEVVVIWGAPVAERTAGTRGYLYYRNGCEVTCGTFDVVFLEDGQVVDAIVRGRGHTYAGMSSSPPDRAAEYTPPRRQPGDDEARP